MNRLLTTEAGKQCFCDDPANAARPIAQAKKSVHSVSSFTPSFCDQKKEASVRVAWKLHPESGASLSRIASEELLECIGL
jgi:hypothetical protein